MLSMRCCGLQEEGPLVLCSQERSGRRRLSKGECRQVVWGMWQGVLQSLGVWCGGMDEGTGGVAGRIRWCRSRCWGCGAVWCWRVSMVWVGMSAGVGGGDVGLWAARVYTVSAPWARMVLCV
jgi:hypothetical protein